MMVLFQLEVASSGQEDELARGYRKTKTSRLYLLKVQRNSGSQEDTQSVHRKKMLSPLLIT